MRHLFIPLAAVAVAASLAVAGPAAAHDHQPSAWGDPAENVLLLGHALEQADLGHETPFLQLAHAGGMAADECHRDKKAGERHWHLDATTERGGACKRHNGKTVRLGHPVDDPPKALVSIDAKEFAAIVSERDRLRSELGNARSAQERQAGQIDDLNRDVRRIADALEDAQGVAARARTERDLAMTDAAAAEARAAGHGPAVSPRCMRGVRAALQKGRFGWSGGAKKALRAACLE